VYPSIGEAIVNTSYQNNMFTIGWGGNQTHCYHRDHVADAQFINGQWRVKLFDRNTGNYVSVHPDFAVELIEGILSNPVLFEKLEKYTKDALKRLDKSVPRLKEEYETAKATQEALQSNVWSKIDYVKNPD
jgi:hypothetical protein